MSWLLWEHEQNGGVLKPTGPATIESLPDPILLDIFDIECAGNCFPRRKEWRPDHENATTLAVLRVCKRWYRISSPLLYRYVNLTVGVDKLDRTLPLFFAILSRNPELRTLTNRLDLLADGLTVQASVSEAEAQRLVQLLRWWRPCLQIVHFHGFIASPNVRAVFFKLAQLPLHELSLSGFFGGISLSFLLKYFQSPHLKTLCLYRHTWTADPDEPSAQSLWGPSREQVRRMGDYLLPPDRQFTADVKSLTICEPFTDPTELEYLMRWPRALDDFSLHAVLRAYSSPRWTPGAVGELLKLHKDTLRKISLCWMPIRYHPAHGDSIIPDVSSFSTLQHLKLSSGNTLKASPAEACTCLGARKLERLVIDFDTEDQHEPHMYSCDEGVKAWLVDFAKAWASMNTDHALKQIFLDLQTDFRVYDPEQEYAWPWYEMKLAKEQLQKYDLNLVWPTTGCPSEDEWPVTVEKAKQQALADREAGTFYGVKMPASSRLVDQPTET